MVSHKKQDTGVKMYEWQATVNHTVKVDEKKALRLKKIGESVCPNPLHQEQNKSQKD